MTKITFNQDNIFTRNLTLLKTKWRRRGGHMWREKACTVKAGEEPGWNIVGGGQGDKGNYCRRGSRNLK